MHLAGERVRAQSLASAGRPGQQDAPARLQSLFFQLLA